MSLNELIAQSGKFQAPDLIGQYAAAQGVQRDMQQNALNTMKMDEMRRATEDQNRLRSAYAGITDYNDPTILNRIGAISPKAAMDMGEYQRKVLESKSKVNKEGADAVATALKNSRIALDGVTTPEQYLQWHLGNHSDPVLGEWLKQRGVTPESAMKRIQEAMTSPEKFQNMVNESKIGAEKTLENNFSNFDTGQQIGVNVMPKYGSGAARVVPGTVMNKQLTPGAAEANQTARDNVDLRRRELEFNQDPVRQAAMAAAKKNAATAITETQDAAKAVKGATEVLSTIGYTIDPKTGIANDRVSDLIRKSTSGPAEYAGAKLYSAGGGATKGDIAIGQLGTYASKLTLDIAGGKLGAGISNTDRDFLERSLGEVANPLLPSEKRLAAWQEARDRLVEISKRSVPKTPTPKASTPSGQGAPANPTPINAWSDWAKNTGRK